MVESSRFNLWNLILGGLSGQRNWQPQWRKANPR